LEGIFLMRVRGGLIGSNPSVSQAVASNIWHIRDAESYTRSNNWAALPGAPTSVSGTAGNAQVALTWTAPAATGGYAITDYAIQYSSDSGSSWTTFSHSASNATAITVTSLTNNTAYVFRVAAVTVLGTGGFGTSAAITPFAGLSFSGTATINANAAFNSYVPTISGQGTPVLTFTKPNSNYWNGSAYFTVGSPSVVVWRPNSGAFSATYNNYLYQLRCTTQNSLFNNLQKDGTYTIAGYGFRPHSNLAWGAYLPSAGTYAWAMEAGNTGTLGTLTIYDPSTITTPITFTTSGWSQSGLVYSKNTAWNGVETFTVNTKCSFFVKSAYSAGGAFKSRTNPNTSISWPWSLQKDGFYLGRDDGNNILVPGTYTLITSNNNPNYVIPIPV
jgi:Fibronectin type III domain